MTDQVTPSERDSIFDLFFTDEELLEIDPDIIDLHLDDTTVDFLNSIIENIADYVCSSGIQSSESSVYPVQFCSHLADEIRKCKLED